MFHCKNNSQFLKVYSETMYLCHPEMKCQRNDRQPSWCTYTAILVRNDTLLNKPYENEVNLRGQNLPLRYC